MPEREQDTVLAYVLDRQPVGQPAATVRTCGPGLTASFVELGPELVGSGPWYARDATLILRRLGTGVTVDRLAPVLGLDPEVLRLVLRGVAEGAPRTGHLGPVVARLSEGKTIAEVAADLDLEPDAVAAVLEPTKELTADLVTELMRRSPTRPPPPGFAGPLAQGPLQTMPVRFPLTSYRRLKQWCEEHNFPMAVVIRGLVERFLDEHAPA